MHPPTSAVASGDLGEFTLSLAPKLEKQFTERAARKTAAVIIYLLATGWTKPEVDEYFNVASFASSKRRIRPL